MPGQWHLDAETYLSMVRAEVPSYDRLQAKLAEATADLAAARILDLGTGTGVTAAAVLARHPEATLVGLDAGAEVLDQARALLPGATFVVGALEDRLPRGPFDLVVSALAIHHLPSGGKADLFRRVAAELRPGGRFVWCDVVVPVAPVAAPVPLEAGVDRPDPLAEQLGWMGDAGFAVSVLHAQDDLAIVRGDLDPAPTS
jgi:tRNA (cmo5U34)-methyltransferase